MIARGHYVAPATRIGKQWYRFSRKDAGKRLSAHVKYIEHRARGQQEERSHRSLFTAASERDEDGAIVESYVSRQQVLEEIMSNTGKKVYYHQFVLSCADDEPVTDGRSLIRDTMRDFERQRGMRLTWFAVEHRNTEHRHWHIVLAGSGVDTESGERRDVIMNQQDYRFLRETAHGRTEHEWQHILDGHYDADDQQEQRDMHDLLQAIHREQETDLSISTENNPLRFLNPLAKVFPLEPQHPSQTKHPGEQREGGIEI